MIVLISTINDTMKNMYTYSFNLTHIYFLFSFSFSFFFLFFIYRFENFGINNGDQAGWRSWMGNGFYVDDGAHHIYAKQCSFYGCEKLGVFVGDIGTSVMVRLFSLQFLFFVSSC